MSCALGSGDRGVMSDNIGLAAARLRLAPFGSFAAVTPFAGANVAPLGECRQPARRYRASAHRQCQTRHQLRGLISFLDEAEPGSKASRR